MKLSQRNFSFHKDNNNKRQINKPKDLVTRLKYDIESMQSAIKEYNETDRNSITWKKQLNMPLNSCQLKTLTQPKYQHILLSSEFVNNNNSIKEKQETFYNNNKSLTFYNNQALILSQKHHQHFPQKSNNINMNNYNNPPPETLYDLDNRILKTTSIIFGEEEQEQNHSNNNKNKKCNNFFEQEYHCESSTRECMSSKKKAEVKFNTVHNHYRNHHHQENENYSATSRQLEQQHKNNLFTNSSIKLLPYDNDCCYEQEQEESFIIADHETIANKSKSIQIVRNDSSINNSFSKEIINNNNNRNTNNNPEQQQEIMLSDELSMLKLLPISEERSRNVSLSLFKNHYSNINTKKKIEQKTARLEREWVKMETERERFNIMQNYSNAKQEKQESYPLSLRNNKNTIKKSVNKLSSIISKVENRRPLTSISSNQRRKIYSQQSNHINLNNKSKTINFEDSEGGFMEFE